MVGGYLFHAPRHLGRRLQPSGLLGLVLRRIALSFLTIMIVSVLVFSATQALPGDPAQARLGRGASPESVAALHDELHLNRPKWEQYTSWLSGLLSGDLGVSLTSGRPVWQEMDTRVINSGFLVLVSAGVSIPLSIFVGVAAALRRGGLIDGLAQLSMLGLVAMPQFVTGVFLIVLLATTFWRVLPAVSLIPPGTAPWQDLSKVWLPSATLVVWVTPYIATIMRASMVEVLESDYIEMARLKGLPERLVVWRHAVPNALGPVLQVIASNLANLVGGAIVVESLFSYPGIGTAMQAAVLNRDFTTVQAIAMIIAGAYVIVNLLADIGVILVTPRLRTKLG